MLNILACLLLCAGCAARTELEPAERRELKAAEALAQLERLAVPAGADPARFKELRSTLRGQLLSAGAQKWTSAAPSDSANAVGDLRLARVDDFIATATWTYRNLGDYDQNSEVNISDLSPLGAHLGKNSASADWNVARAADGDGNGQVSVSDLTPLGSHLLNTVDAYSIQSTTTPEVESSWSELAQVPLALATPAANGPRAFTTVVPAVADQSFRVVPLHGSAQGVPGLAVFYNGISGGTGSQLSWEDRSLVLEAIKEKYDYLTTETSDEQDAELAEFIGSLPNIEASGYVTGNAWGRFTDGRIVIAEKNRAPHPAEAEGHSASTLGLPQMPQGSLLNAFEPHTEYGSFRSPVNDLNSIMQANAYESYAGRATLHALITNNEGFFYIDAHGGQADLQSGDSAYWIWTGEHVTKETDELWREDFEAGRLGYMIASDNTGREAKYCFSDAFVLEYMDFSDNSLIFINACQSGNAQDMIDAFFFVGASAYLGWTIDVPDPVANKAAKHIFDRLLGANELSRVENPPIRPFDLITTVFDMYSRGVSGAKPLVKYPPPPPPPSELTFLIMHADDGDLGTGFRVFAPSIQQMVMFDNDDELRLIGIFGDLEGTVTVGGTEVEVRSWDQSEIRCTLPVTGAGSAGEVVVNVLGHKSNPRNLTEWRGDFSYTRSGPGGLERTAAFDVHFRADVGDYRYFPDTNPLLTGLTGDGTVEVFGAVDCSATVTSEGSYTNDSGYTTTWMDGPVTSVPIYYGSFPPNDFSQVNGTFKLTENKFYVDLYVTGDFREKYEDDEGQLLWDELHGYIEDLSELEDGDGVPIDLGADFTLQGGMLEAVDGEETFTLSWGAIEPAFPPDPAAPR